MYSTFPEVKYYFLWYRADFAHFKENSYAYMLKKTCSPSSHPSKSWVHGIADKKATGQIIHIDKAA